MGQRSSKAPVSRSEPNTLVHSSNGRLLVPMVASQAKQRCCSHVRYHPDAIFTAIHPDFYSDETPYLLTGVKIPGQVIGS